MSSTFSDPTVYSSYSRAAAIPENGLPSGRGTMISSSSNTSLETAQSLGTLRSDSVYNGNVSSSDTQDYYRFDFSNPNNANFLLSGLGANVELQLLDGTGKVINSASNTSGAARAISTNLTPGTYYVRVHSVDARPTPYHLSLVNGNAYYVSPYGSDGNSGGFAAPFQSIQKAATVAQAGSTVFVREGYYYEREIALRNSGTADRPITFASTPGERAVIDQGLAVPSWSPVGNGVYVGTPTLPNSSRDRSENTVRIVVGNKPLIEVSRRADLVEGTFWRDPGSGALYVWAARGVDPGTKETLITNRYSGRSTNEHYAAIALYPGANHITIDGFTIRSADTGIWAVHHAGTPTGYDLKIRNCEIKFSWDAAIRLDNWNGALIENCNIHNNGQVALPNYGTWPHAILGFNSSNVTVSNNRIHHNHGEGVGPFKGSSRWSILNNVVHDNWSVNIYVDTELGDVTVDGNFVYNSNGSDQDNNQKDGIRIANEPSDLDRVGKPGVNNITITNNVILNTGGGIRFFPYKEDTNKENSSFLQNSLIANNTIANTSGNREGIYVRRGDNVQVKNNVVYPKSIVLESGFGKGIIAENNLASDDSSSLRNPDSGVYASNNTFGNPQFTAGSGLDPRNYSSQKNGNAGAKLKYG